MKKLAALSITLFATMNVQGQITIDQSSFASWSPGTDTFSNVSQYTATPAANAVWDLGNATYGSTYTTTKVAAANAAFPQAGFKVSANYIFSSFTYTTDIYMGITAQGYQRFGEVVNRQAFPLGSLTLNVLDSLVFPAQTLTYSSPRQLLSFPATYNATWSSNYSFDTDFELSVAAFSLNQAPGYRRNITAITDSVKGWGTMTIKRLDGQMSAPINVLALKTRVRVMDSFFLNGSPAPNNMLQPLGLSQGMLTNDYQINYYREGEAEPLLTETYTDGSYTTKSSASVHQNNIPVATTNVADINGAYEIKLFPNPAITGTVSLELPKELSRTGLSFQMRDISGKMVSAGQLQVNGSTATIQVTGLAAGSYSVTILKDGRYAAMRKLMLQ